MIRIGWQVPNSAEWVGGLNYFINLTTALYSISNRQIEPILLGTAQGLPAPLSDCKILPYPSFSTKRWNPMHIMDVLLRKYMDAGGLLALYLRRNGIRLLSHGQLLGRRSPVAALCWIPDFQHIHLPKFFSKEEYQSRNVLFKDISQRAQAVILSSEDAQKDFATLFPKEVDKTYVLHFVASVPTHDLPSLREILNKYKIYEPYFHVPNQLWAHKNHKIIVEALRILKKHGNCPLIISTGQTNDYRNPDYFKKLFERVQTQGLSERFRFLGLIPYKDMTMLMRGAIAMINPSLFEGWSTTVEEAKSLGKQLILSNIGVHLEQNPEYGFFFDPHSPQELADTICIVMQNYSLNADQERMRLAKAKLPQRISKYGHDYQDIILKILNN